MFDNKEQDDKNKKHAENPEVGDAWWEMLSFILVVVDVSPMSVTTCETKKRVDGSHWTWDTEAPLKTYTRYEFSQKFRYKSIDGYSADISGKKHEWVAEEILKRNIK